MPWKPDQARAIAISYKRRGKKPPPEVRRALSASLKGKPMPKKHSSARDRLARKRHKRRKRGHRRK